MGMQLSLIRPQCIISSSRRQHPSSKAAPLLVLTSRCILCRLEDLSSIFTYQGEETCAADGMCQVKCPVKINTGELIKHIRHENLGDQSRAQKVAMVGPRPSTSTNCFIVQGIVMLCARMPLR